LSVRVDSTDGAQYGIGDTVDVTAPHVGLVERKLKVASKKWIWKGDEHFIFELGSAPDSPADILLELQKKVTALTRTTQNVNARENEEI